MHRGARYEAQQKGAAVYFTGVPCKRGHIAERYTRTGYCKVCAREAGRKSYAENPERFAQASRKWRTQNPEYAEENRDRINANSQAYRLRNLSKAARLRAQYRARKKQAEPSWLTARHHTEIAAFYDLAALRTRQTGESYEVDHIVPLSGDNVCGLHVPWNLQVIPQAVNRRKSNLTDFHPGGTH